MRDLFITWCTEAGCTVDGGPRGQHLRAPARRRRSPAAGADGQPPRHPVRGRQVRRHRGRAGRARGAAHPRRPPACAPSARSSWCAGPTRRARASRPRWSPRARSRASSTWTGCSICATTTASGSAASSSASATSGKERGGRPGHRRLLRAAHRAGADPRPRGGAGRHRGGRLRGARHARGRARRDRALGPDPDGPAAQRARGRRDAGGGGQRHRLEVPCTEGKATVARLVAWPNKAGILAEYAQLTCDVRHAERAVADQMWAEVKAAIPTARAGPTWRCASRGSGSSAASTSIRAASA